MITFNFDITTGTVRLAASAVVVLGADVPVRVVFSAAPGSVDAIQLALGTDAASPEVLAFTEDFTSENATTWSGVLDASDTRLAAFMANKGSTPVNAELICTLDGLRQPAPHLPITVQKPIVTGPETSEGGPDYYTDAQVDALLPARLVNVADSTARLALTTATVRAGDFVREIGRAEVTKLTCLGSTYTAAVAEVVEFDCTGLVAADLGGTSLYLHPDPAGVLLYDLFWFRLDGAGASPDGTGLTDGVDANFHRVDIITGLADTAIAEALRVAIAATTRFTAVRTGAVVRVTWVTAGPFYDAGDIDSGAVFTEVTAGANATHTLEGTTLTLLNGAGASVTVGFALAGSTGTIAVTLPTSTRTAAQIAALTQAAIDAHADFSAVQGTGGASAEVTVTNVTNGLVSQGTGTGMEHAVAGSTGFTVTVLTAGKTGALLYELVDETQIGSEAGWNELPTTVSFSASNASGSNQSLSAATNTQLNFTTQDWDTHNQFDPVLKRFICKVPGKYSFSLSADIACNSSSQTRKILNLYKNGSLFKRLVDLQFTSGAGADHIIDGTGVLFDLAAGDYIEPFASSSLAATAYFDSAARSFFQALRVGP